MFGKKKKKSIDPSESDDHKELLRHIKLAILTEKRGIKFYKQAKKTVDDINMSRLIDVLLDQEYTHLKFFKEIYRAEKKKGEVYAAKKAEEYKKQPRMHDPLFSRKHLHEITKNKSTIFHLFRQAINFEQKGHDLYMDIAKKVKNKKIKKFLKMVAREELKHRDYIQMHEEAIYDTGYWHGIGHVRLET